MPRMLHSAPCRFLVVLLATVLVLTLATPAKAEAIEPFTVLAIAGAAVIVLVLVIYLVVANVEGPKMGAELDGPRIAQPPAPTPQVVWVAITVPRESP